MALINQFLEAQRRYQAELLSKAGVVGVGIGYKNADRGDSDDLSVVAMVEQKKPMVALSAEDKVPPELNGIKTDVVEVGVIRAQNTSSRDRWRPTIPSGVSIAHYMVTAGTLGTLVYDDAGTAYILSNNHVLANSNDAFVNDAILQPGPTDGGQQGTDKVATLYSYARISYTDENVVGDANPIIGKDTVDEPDTPDTPDTPEANGCAQFIIAFADTLAKANDPDVSVQVVRTSSQTTSTRFDPYEATSIQAQASIPENQLDAALALPVNAGMFQRNILQIGAVDGTMPVSLGMTVRKYGRTSQLTQGTVTLINATVDVGYRTAAGAKTARFTGQVMSTGMSQGGDSGSLIVDANSLNAVGLLFAGSGTATIFTPIERVLNKFGVKITP